MTVPTDATATRRFTNNLSTGQSQKLLINGTRTKFIFGNLIPDMKYSLYALAPNGNVIGKHLDFMMPKEGMEYKFENLLPLRDVKAHALRA